MTPQGLSAHVFLLCSVPGGDVRGQETKHPPEEGDEAGTCAHCVAPVLSQHPVTLTSCRFDVGSVRCWSCHRCQPKEPAPKAAAGPTVVSLGGSIPGVRGALHEWDTPKGTSLGSWGRWVVPKPPSLHAFFSRSRPKTRGGWLAGHGAPPCVTLGYGVPGRLCHTHTPHTSKTHCPSCHWSLGSLANRQPVRMVNPAANPPVLARLSMPVGKTVL